MSVAYMGKVRMKMEQLKPCPFCGEEAQIFTDDEMGYLGNAQYLVRCGNCLCGTGHYNNPEYAIEAWNKRANNEEDAKC